MVFDWATGLILNQFKIRSNSFNASNACLLGCNCELAPLYPVCDRHGTVFYSPCHAGCHLTDLSAFLNYDKTPIFNDCGCAKGREVSREFCEEGDCRHRMYWYFGNMAAGGIIGGMGVVPGVLIMLRSVPPKHRSISLGFNGFLVSLLGLFMNKLNLLILWIFSHTPFTHHLGHNNWSFLPILVQKMQRKRCLFTLCHKWSPRLVSYILSLQ